MSGAHFSVERMAAGGASLQIRALGVRRHRSPRRWPARRAFSAVKGVLRVYWRALGRQSHVGEVTPFPVGAAVRLVPGAIRYFECDESPVVIQDTPAARSQTWRVVRYEGPDITNMPSYLVQHEDTFMTARHESLDLARE